MSALWARLASGLKRLLVAEPVARDPVGDLRPWTERHRRLAYFPNTAAGEGPARASRFNGRPFLLESETWPACAYCARPMPLFVQLDLDALPAACAGAYGSGLLQLFFCVCGDDAADEAFDHKAKLVRILPDAAPGAIVEAPDLAFAPAAQAITGWTAKPECCQIQEAAEHGIEARYRYFGQPRYLCAELGIDTGWIVKGGLKDAVEREVFNAAEADKLGGWPYWVQRVEYPRCTLCGTRMRLVFQLASQDHVPHMFGDGGVGHITQCPTHKEVVTFAWACH